MANFETFSAYLSRLITFQDLIYIAFLMVLALLLRKPLARMLRISVRRYLLIALAFSGVIGLSLRFWVASGYDNTFWVINPLLWAAGIHANANLVLNIALYVPPTMLLVLARKSWWQVLISMFAMSFIVETIQQYARIGAADPIDLVANFLGSVLGVLLGLVIVKVLPRFASKPQGSDLELPD